MRYTGPFGEPLARFWRASVMPWVADHGLMDCPRYGIPLDDPARVPRVQCRYDACIELPPGLVLPDAPETIIPGGRYAVTQFKGTASEMGAAWTTFVGSALATAQYRLDPQRLPYEQYPRGAFVDLRTGVFGCELCLPVIDP